MIRRAIPYLVGKLSLTLPHLIEPPKNGVNQGSPQDEYAPTVTYGMRDLGTATLSSGNQAFKFYVTGKNPSSSNYNLVFDYIELVP